MDVSAFNASIMRIVDYWALQQVNCIEGSYDLFFNRKGMPSNHYYSVDGTHLSHSGIKRLLDAWNRHLEIVKDLNVCVFQTNQTVAQDSWVESNRRISSCYNVF